MSWQLRIYVSIDAETSKVGPSIKKALGSADGHAAAAGKSAGSRMASALGTALKGAAATTGAAAVAGVGVAMAKGFERLNAIDQAKAKLSGLGNSASDVTKIMDNALASVKGTAFGMGDAAGLAGTMVAAGIKPGKELETTLKRVADSAAIAGDDLGSMGMVWGKIAAKGKLDGETVNQLLERQIPIYDILGKKMGKNSEEIAKMVSEGKISFQDFSDAMNDRIGGAALKMGDTFKGAFDNVTAAAGRLGASALEPFFKRSTGGMKSMTDALDAAEPKVKEFAQALDAKIFDEWGPKLQEAWAAAKDSQVLDQTLIVLRGMAQAGIDVLPTLMSIGQELAKASAAVGVGTWQLFLTALSATGAALEAVTPALEGLSDLMQEHPALVVAAVAAWTAFKTIPSIAKPAGAATEGLARRLGGLVGASTASAEATAAVAAAQANLAKAQVGAQSAAAKTLVAEESLARVRASGAATAGAVAVAEARVAEARLAETTATTRATAAQAAFVSSQRAAASSAAGFGSSIRTAYQQGAAGATNFHRTAGMAAVAMRGLKSAGTGVMNLFGGPWGAAMVGAGAVIGLVMNDMSKSKQRADEYAAAVSALGKAHIATTDAIVKSRGAMNDDVTSALVAEIEATIDVADKTTDAIKRAQMAQIVTPEIAAQTAQINDLSTVLSGLGMSADSVGKAMRGSRGEWDQFIGNLRSANVPQEVLVMLQRQRMELEQTRDAARKATPGIAEMAEAVRVMGDKSSTAAEKTNALKSALDSMNPARTAGEALAKHAETIDKVTQSTKQAIDASKGIGDQLILGNGEVNVRLENGRNLRESILGIVDASRDAAAAGKYDAQMQQDNATALAALAAQYKISKDEIKGIANSLGADDLDLIMRVSVEDDATQKMAFISAQWAKTPDKKTINVEAGLVTEETIATLRAMGNTVQKMPNGSINVTAKTEDAQRKVMDFKNQFTSLDKTTAAPSVGLNDVVFKGKNAEVRRNLEELKNQHVSPEADLAIQKLLDGKNLSMQELQTLDQVRANPKVDADTAEAIVKVQEINRLLDIAARSRTATVTAAYTGSAVGLMAGTQADGSIVPARAYVDGGISAAESFANGGLKEIVKPTRADIFAGRGAGTIFAEQETGGEAYIPLAASKRGRSTDILATVARMFGLAVVPADSISGLLGGIAGGAVSSLLKKAGADKVTRFADGGISAAALKQHMQGIQGAPYVWGGWGQGYATDCSGGQSIGVMATEGNMAAGTGERAGTASFSSYLPAHGYHIGQAPAGQPAHEIGWSDAHTSGTIFDPAGGDVNFEMGGGNGGGAYGGGAVSSRDGQFPNHAYVLLSAADGTTPTVNPDGTTTTTPDATTTTPDTTTTSTAPAASQETTFSGKLGAAAGSFVSGQLQSLFGVLGINDSPGALAAYNEYERQRTEQANKGQGSSGLTTQDAVNKGADPKKLRDAEDKVTDTEASLATARARLAETRANPKAKESAKLAAEARVAKLERELEQARKDLEELKKQQQATPVTPVPQSGDPNVGALTGTDAVKAAARSALKARGWDTGAQWDSTDWIFTRESSWNPAARNGQYLGLGQLSPDARKSIGDSLDPAEQTSAYADYVAARYQVPTAAQQFWEANNWYDQGGIASAKGVMLKNVNQPERVLSPAQTKSFDAMVKKDFQSGSDAEVVARLDKLIALTERLHDKIDRGGDTYNWHTDGSAKKDMDELRRAQYAARLAGV